jgi:hypothetical protein
MEHLPRPNVVVYPAVSNSVMERREGRNVREMRALTSYSEVSAVGSAS